MRISEKRKNVLKIAAMTSMAVFVLFSVFSGTAAWFGMNQKISSDGTNMQVGDRGNKFSKMSLHPIVKINLDASNNPTSFVFDKSYTSASITAAQLENGTGSISFEMDRYTLLRTRNPMLALIELKEATTVTADLPFRVSFSLSERSIYVGSRTASEVSAMIDSSTDLPLSSVIKFSGGYLTGSDLEDNDGSTAIEDISQTGSMPYDIDPSKTSTSQYILDAPTSYSSFVTFTNGNPVMASQDAFSNAFAGSVGEIVKYVYFIFDYNETSLDYIYNKFLGESFLEDDLHFSCDWSVLV